MDLTNFGIGTSSPKIEILVGIFGSFGADGIGGKGRLDKAEKFGIDGIVGIVVVTFPIALSFLESLVPDGLMEVFVIDLLITGEMLEVLDVDLLIAGELLEVSAVDIFIAGELLEVLFLDLLIAGELLEMLAGILSSSACSTPASNTFFDNVRAETQMFTKTSENTRSSASNRLFMVILRRMFLVWKRNAQELLRAIKLQERFSNNGKCAKIRK